MPPKISLDRLNRQSADEFVQALEGIYEHSPWIPADVWRQRPFADTAALHAALRQTVTAATRGQQLALLRAHPELAGKEAQTGSLTQDSTAEQAGAGLVNLSAAEQSEIAELNGAYRRKFSFPFIIAVRNHTKTSILEEFRRRAAGSDVEQELRVCLDQVHDIARLRLEALLGTITASP
jgi:2-oxo-4-hydroxy-4-carboxy-5-ureidoimidazoline decarboxylase